MSKIKRWIPAFILMVVIYLASGTTSTNLPNYGNWDTFVKKGGHMLGYALLANSFWYGLGLKKEKAWQAWLLAVIYALTDEFHQSFTPGRHPSLVDVFLFDGGGAVFGLSVSGVFLLIFNQKTKKEKPISDKPYSNSSSNSSLASQSSERSISISPKSDS